MPYFGKKPIFKTSKIYKTTQKKHLKMLQWVFDTIVQKDASGQGLKKSNIFVVIIWDLE
jgi:hypothetical protein